jgi:hypothetical protein
MLGLSGFVLRAVSDYAGELEQAIETVAVEELLPRVRRRGPPARPAPNLGTRPARRRPTGVRVQPHVSDSVQPDV